MGIYCKCFNCQRKITDTDINKKTGYLFGDEKAVCDRCYFMFFGRVRDFLYEKPGSDMDQIRRGTNTPLKLIELFYDEGALEEAVQQKVAEGVLREQQEKEEALKRLQRQQSISELKKYRQIITKDNNDKPQNDNAARMRFCEHHGIRRK